MTMASDPAPTVTAVEYSLVIPVLNEAVTLDELARRVIPVLDDLPGPAEVVLVDDGSTDGSFEIMQRLHREDPRFHALRLSRNFGHQIAISAGLDHARGEAVVIMDADLQDPPEVILSLAAKWREGYQVVYAVRDEREGETRVKLATARWFYRLMGHLSDVEMPRDAGDFRLIDRTVVDAVKAMPEHRPYLRGLFAWVGYDQVGVHYERAARHAGRTKFSMAKMVAFASNGIVSFSTLPLRLALSAGFVVSSLSLLGALFGVVAKVVGWNVVPGWASLVVFVGILGGFQLLVLGIMGEYIARIHDEVKARPLYLLRDQVGLDR